ncbi:unnamed protein product [Cyclocybe aegerita]|uniref:FAD dependent oxidoreductase domain-containing protein n=1 Tax=Cyclocybe aegerita TaxID=1973307 RepID=A0A8S0XZ73_CYCAE|nr:unnamed protein product [Cyclocybe aegerita]
MRNTTHFNGLVQVTTALLSFVALSRAFSKLSYLPHPNPIKSFWLHPPSANPLRESGSAGELTSGADVCIIGSGLTGVGTAWHLVNQLGSGEAETKKKIVVLDAREFCSGATGRNGGHLTPAVFSGFREQERLHGTDEARRSHHIERHTSNALLKFIKDNSLESDVDLFEGGHLGVFRGADEEAAGKADWEAARKAGVDMGGPDGEGDVRWIGTEELVQKYGVNPDLNYTAVWFNAHNLWPSKLVTKLFLDVQNQRAGGAEVVLHTKTPVTSISKLDAERWSLHTPRGDIACNYVVHATNAYTGHLLPFLRGDNLDIQDITDITDVTQFPLSLRPRGYYGITPTRGQIGAVRASVDSEGLGWHNSWGTGARAWQYWFPRYQDVKSDAGHRPLIVLGGGRNQMERGTTDDSILDSQVEKALKAFLPWLFPKQFIEEDAEEAWEMEWTGIMGYTSTGEPLVGPVRPLGHRSRLPAENPYEGQYIAAGFSGHGMPRTFSCAEAVAGMIAAKIRGKEWTTPDWLPRRYLTWATEP